MYICGTVTRRKDQKSKSVLAPYIDIYIYTYIYVFFLSLGNHTVENGKNDEIHLISTSLVQFQVILPTWEKSHALCPVCSGALQGSAVLSYPLHDGPVRYRELRRKSKFAWRLSHPLDLSTESYPNPESNKYLVEIVWRGKGGFTRHCFTVSICLPSPCTRCLLTASITCLLDRPVCVSATAESA